MLGGVNVAEGSIPYVARLVFDPYNMERSEIDNNLFTQCSGTIIHRHFIITSKSGIHVSVDRRTGGFPLFYYPSPLLIRSSLI